ncbi:hypothetical protein NQ318_008005 [Aromia moschata]|uniref:Ribosomal protein S3 n=1 Tax=Aromia moschata TaxID=1265417 RepID=A0AAV8XTS6_9CUCU|nr:hypothetical protein NQ318_008005 [Aromia moschata]
MIPQDQFGHGKNDGVREIPVRRSVLTENFKNLHKSKLSKTRNRSDGRQMIPQDQFGHGKNDGVREIPVRRSLLTENFKKPAQIEVVENSKSFRWSSNDSPRPIRAREDRWRSRNSRPTLRSYGKLEKPALIDVDENSKSLRWASNDSPRPIRELKIPLTPSTRLEYQNVPPDNKNRRISVNYKIYCGPQIIGYGRPKLSTPEQGTASLRYLRDNPFAMARDAVIGTGFPGSQPTASRRVNESELKNYPAAKKNVTHCRTAAAKDNRKIASKCMNNAFTEEYIHQQFELELEYHSHLISYGRQSINVLCGILNNKIIGPIFFNGSLTGVRYLSFLRNSIANLLDDIPLHEACGLWMRANSGARISEYGITAMVIQTFKRVLQSEP